ncbi:MAG: efflux RND transporter periplasmic adaptor subunit [Bryobacterales bacterium]|nr:efflux RND transporter periplasmic adaptor subunit [Bryobacterales bacterium]MDE0294672.1 efflux RND transporter periplasmic adaptor subunit [Bryobacterales bacterium]MDE0433636.1 efflux RND transporter periplasmic adaptor subunit [Bryobacterales bacterium]
MASDTRQVDQRLASLKIDRSQRGGEPARWAKWWIIIGVVAFIALGIWRFGFAEAGLIEVDTIRVIPQTAGSSGQQVVLNAAGYVIAHYKIEVASKVLGKVAWIGVEKGDAVSKGDPIVRVEDDEYRARVRQTEGNLAALQARLAELEAGSRPEEIQLARANLAEAKADLENARVNLDRVRTLHAEGVVPQQDLDDAKARYDARQARVASLDRAYELVRIGPRQEEIDFVRGQVKQAEGELAFTRTQLDATVIRAPVTGTILERNVEVGEFITTSFVGERGAKGFVVSLADLNDLQVELDISQDDFAKLTMGQSAVVATDAFPDRKYKSTIVEMSPEADRQKATVQVKVQILEPDSFLRPEMNANVAFLAEQQPADAAPARPTITIPTSALVNGDSVFVVQDGRTTKRAITVRKTTPRGVEIGGGLSGGEEIVVSPPQDLQDGAPIRVRQ